MPMRRLFLARQAVRLRKHIECRLIRFADHESPLRNILRRSPASKRQRGRSAAYCTELYRVSSRSKLCALCRRSLLSHTAARQRPGELARGGSWDPSVPRLGSASPDGTTFPSVPGKVSGQFPCPSFKARNRLYVCTPSNLASQRLLNSRFTCASSAAHSSRRSKAQSDRM